MHEPHRTDVYVGGGAAEVAARLSTFAAKWLLNVCASIIALTAERQQPSSLSTNSQSFTGRPRSDSTLAVQKSVHFWSRNRLYVRRCSYHAAFAASTSRDLGMESLRMADVYLRRVEAYFRSSRRVRRFAARHSASNQGSVDRCRRVTWRHGTSRSSSTVSSLSYKSAIASMSLGHRSSWHSCDVNNNNNIRLLKN